MTASTLRWIPVALLVALLAACASEQPRSGGGGGATATDNIHASQSDRYAREHDGGPTGPVPDISKLPEPVPHVEPLSEHGNGSPYEVRGKTYYVLPTARGYDKVGEASWYGNKFHGYHTSNMETYDMYKFTAASKVLPLPTFARVTNLANGKSVIVRVNDRGPFVPGRIIDLSYAAARRIGIWPKGVGKVRVQAIDPRVWQARHRGQAASQSDRQVARAPSVKARRVAAVGNAPVADTARPDVAIQAPVVDTPTPTATPPAAAGTSGVASTPTATASAAGKTTPAMQTGHVGNWIQVGAFADRANAMELASRLRRTQSAPVQLTDVMVGGQRYTRVTLGPLKTAAQARSARAAARRLGLL